MTKEEIADLLKRFDNYLAQHGHSNLKVVIVEKDGKCKKCGLAEVEYKQQGKHLGKYCVKCGSWITWVKQGETEL